MEKVERLDRGRGRGVWILLIMCLFTIVLCMILSRAVSADDVSTFVDIGMVAAVFAWLLCVIYWQQFRGFISPNLGTVILILLAIAFAIYFSSGKSGEVLLPSVFVGLLAYIAFNTLLFRPLEKGNTTAAAASSESKSWVERMKMMTAGVGVGAAGVLGMAAGKQGGGTGNEEEEDEEEEEEAEFDSPEAVFEAWTDKNAAFVDKFLDLGKCLLVNKINHLPEDEGDEKTRTMNLNATFMDENTSRGEKLGKSLPAIMRLYPDQKVLQEFADRLDVMATKGDDIPAANWKLYYSKLDSLCKQLEKEEEE